MVPLPAPSTPAYDTTFVCPFCETTFAERHPDCPRCGGHPIVPVESTAVYESVLPLCGPDCDCAPTPTGRETTREIPTPLADVVDSIVARLARAG